MSETWLEVINQTSAESLGSDSRQCDGCLGIRGAADDEVCDHRCSLCHRPLSGASLWLVANQGYLTQAQLEEVTRVLIPERNKDYRVRYYSDVLETGLISGLMTKAQAEFMAGSVRGTVIKENG